MSSPLPTVDEDRPPSLGWPMWRRFLVAAIVIAGLAGGATATVALNTVSGLAHEILAPGHIATPKGLITPPYEGEPQTFLILGSDRREKSKDSFDRNDPPHSDTILLVRFDPQQGQTSVLSIPRDLMVNIKTPGGQLYEDEKINAAYTIGSKEHREDGGIILAAETIEREVFPQLKLNGIIDVNFAGFIRVVDALGCAYVNVDHRYLGGGELDEDYSSINLQPGYQKLCYENALSYVRYRHGDSDLVRVARQQDFLRDLREQITLGADPVPQIKRIAHEVGHAIRSSFPVSAEELLLLSKLIAFSQTKPLRQVKFAITSADTQLNGGDYVTSSAELEKETLARFLYGQEGNRLNRALAGEAAATRPAPSTRGHHHHHPAHHAASPASIDLVSGTGSTGEEEAVKAALATPFRVLYPGLQTGPAETEMVRAYGLHDEKGKLHHAYVVVYKEGEIGQYYDFEGTDWLGPPLFAHAREETIGGRKYLFIDDGEHIHVVGWRSKGVLYWVTNTLLEDLSNAQMLAIAKSARPLR